MSNLGLQKALEGRGIEMLRTPVGDKYVLEEMLKRGAALGGEQSGHVIFSEYATTGDGLLTALQVLKMVRDAGETLDELAAEIKNFPQKAGECSRQVQAPLAELPAVQAEIDAAEQAFGGSGRVVVRFSGTEPLARVMIEGPRTTQVEQWTDELPRLSGPNLGAAVLARWLRVTLETPLKLFPLGFVVDQTKSHGTRRPPYQKQTSLPRDCYA